jgi:hypothetical protein
MIRLSMAVCVALLGLSASRPDIAQAQPAESADIGELRAIDDCLLYVGTFIATMKDEHNPSADDRVVFNEVMSVADRLIYASEQLTEAVGADVQARIVGEQHAILQTRLAARTGDPNVAALLRADFTPDMRACAVRGMSLEIPPK